MKNHLSMLVLTFICFSQLTFAQCFISGGGQLGQLYTSTGNSLLDNKFFISKLEMENVFQVRVELYIYNDDISPNAFAMPSSQNFDGLIAFGRNMLFSRLWRRERGEYAVTGVLAHEFAHILQLRMMNNLPTKRKELHADFLAGYYFGRMGYLLNGLQNFAQDLFSLGDFNFWNPNHHGMPHERVSAMMAGLATSRNSLHEAYTVGINYVIQNH